MTPAAHRVIGHARQHSVHYGVLAGWAALMISVAPPVADVFERPAAPSSAGRTPAAADAAGGSGETAARPVVVEGRSVREVSVARRPGIVRPATTPRSSAGDESVPPPVGRVAPAPPPTACPKGSSPVDLLALVIEIQRYVLSSLTSGLGLASPVDPGKEVGTAAGCQVRDDPPSQSPVPVPSKPPPIPRELGPFKNPL